MNRLPKTPSLIILELIFLFQSAVRLAITSCIGLYALAISAPVAAQPQSVYPAAQTQFPRLTVAGPIRTIYRWATDRCEDEFIPDSPARAFRRADGKIALMATHRENWMLIGETFHDMRTLCKSVFSTQQFKRQGGSGEQWIQAVYTQDGRQVHALVSQDFSLQSRRNGCRPSATGGQCWLNSIASAVSDNMGESFRIGQTVASIANSYPANHTGRLGVFTATNIARGSDDKYYLIAFVDYGTSRGNCIFQNDDPAKPSRWQAWSGHRFDIDMTQSTASALCVPIGGGRFQNEIRALLWSSAHRLWVVVTTARLKMPGDHVPVPGFYASTSSDLFNWSPMQRIMKAPTRPREEQLDYFVSYPSLIDINSKSMNFDTIDEGPLWLFFTWHHLKNGQGTFNRDLVAVPLSLSP